METLPEDEIRAKQRSEALEQRDALQSLTVNPGWLILEQFMREQIRARTDDIILQPCTGVKSQLEQEYSKGEIASMRLMLQFVETGILTAKAVVRSLNDDPDDGTDDPDAADTAG